MPRALLSVSDKSGLVPFAEELSRRGWTLLSTGGTAAALRDAGLVVTDVSEITGHPEIMDGRVKTLHPAVHAGLLGRRGHPGDEAQMSELGYESIDMVVVNLYPFKETIARPEVTLEEAIEQIDIGGPSMLRSAAKNHASVWVVTDSNDYPRVLSGLEAEPGPAAALRRELAIQVFATTSAYDTAIADYLRSTATPQEAPGGAESGLPQALELELQRVQTLRYGENPDQAAAFYRHPSSPGGFPAARQLHGKALSYINLLDADAAALAVSGWPARETAACAIIKHATPCGLAVGSTVAEAYRKALATDPLSAYGSVIAFNRPVDGEAAELMRGNFVEAIVAPGFAPEALELLTRKKNLRLIELPEGGSDDALDYRAIQGGMLVQQRIRMSFPEEGWRVVTSRKPGAAEWADLRFAWRAVATVKSNAILLARDGATLGIGAGQMSRVDASRIAVMKAGDQNHVLYGASLASDAFFPFRDGVDAAAAAGVTAIIQPGGSVRDEEVIAAADEHDIAMVFTGRRLFRH